MAFPRGTRSPVAYASTPPHAGARAGYDGSMTDPLPDPIPDPDDLPQKDASGDDPLEPTPLEPSVTNPDADGIDDSVPS